MLDFIGKLYPTQRPLIFRSRMIAKKYPAPSDFPCLMLRCAGRCWVVVPEQVYNVAVFKLNDEIQGFTTTRNEEESCRKREPMSEMD
jgi:hypothetical protein